MLCNITDNTLSAMARQDARDYADANAYEEACDDLFFELARDKAALEKTISDWDAFNGDESAIVIKLLLLLTGSKRHDPQTHPKAIKLASTFIEMLAMRSVNHQYGYPQPTIQQFYKEEA